MRERHPVKRLSAFLDDELREDEALSVTRHLDRCSECAEELEGLRRARSALRGLPAVPSPPSGLWEDVPETVPEHVRRPMALLVASALVFSIISLVFALGGRPSGEVVPPVELVVFDHVSRTSGGPVIQPVNLGN